MTTRKYSSRSQQTTLSAALTSSGTSATVVSGTSLLGGATISAGETFTVVIDPDTALEEIVDVTAVSTNTLTIVRGIDGSTGVAHSAGAVVRHMAIGRDYREANTHIENTTTAHGLTLANVVKTTDTGTVTNGMLAGSIADSKLSTISTANKVSNSATTATSSNTASAIVARDASGNFTAGTITATLSGNASTVTNGVYTTDTGTVTSTMIANGTIVNADINASAAIDSTKISGTAVTQADTGTVTSTMIANGTIVDADINASAAIDKTKISGTAITAGDTGTVTSTMIANDTIVNADINSSAGIAYSKLSLNGSITSADIVDGTIVNADINASAAIALSKLATDPLARANHTGTQTASTISDFDTQVRTSRLDQMAAPTGSVSLNSQKITSLGTPSASGDAATKGYIDTQITNLINGAPGTLDTLKEIADQIQAGGTFYDSVLFKSGGTMTGNLTLAGAPSSNLHAATKLYVDDVAGSATAAAASAAAAAASYDSFDDRYLGAKSSAPTLDNDGNALVTGALYWNSVSATMFAWTGSAWGSISSTAAIYRYKFVATGGETSVSGTDANGVTLSYLAGKEQVYLNGVLLVRSTDYTASNGTSITSLAALAASDILEVITFTAFDLATAIPNTTIDAKGDLLAGTAADTVGKLSVGTNGYYLKANSSTATGLEWAAVDALPSQTGNNGKYLTTDGSSASWGTIDLSSYATTATVENNLIMNIMGAL